MFRASAFLILFSMFIIATSCTEEPEELSASSAWGIDFSGIEHAGNAYGYISYQNPETNQSFLVDAGYVRQIRNERYKITYTFSSQDSLRIIIAKRTGQQQFAFPKPDTVNQLLFAIYNTDTLRLTSGSVTVQPQVSTNSLRTIANLQVRNAGTFSGTIDGMPLVE